MLSQILHFLFKFLQIKKPSFSLSFSLQRENYSRGHFLSGSVIVEPFFDFFLPLRGAVISLRRKISGEDKRLRDFFQENNIFFPKQTWKMPYSFRKGEKISFSFVLNLFFNKKLSLIKKLQQIQKEEERDVFKVGEYISSLESFSWYFQVVIGSSITIEEVNIKTSFIDEALEWLISEKSIICLDKIECK